MFRWFLLALLIIVAEHYIFKLFPEVPLSRYTLYGIQIFILALFVTEYYSYQTIKSIGPPRWLLVSYQILSILVLLYISYTILTFDRTVGQTKYTLRASATLLLVFLPKIFMALVMIGQDISREVVWLANYFNNPDKTQVVFPRRRKFVGQVALALAAIPFGSLVYGITEGKYHFRVLKQKLFFPDLPDAFDGFRILQISDVHSGSFDNKEKIEYAISLINEQQADMCLFTGDIVNTTATEMHPWIDTFNKIKSYPYGKFSVLGNHDYGEYVDWPSAKAKDDNFRAIKNLYGEIGFELMLNQHRFIEKDGQKIALVGVENWGKGFKQVGDLNKASQGLSKEDFKILMSHDPSHWELEVKNHPKNFQLTLAGHTHGLQFGIEIPGFIKWSPIQYIYKQWAGLYEHVGRYIYVNRGFGFHAYPGRVGIWPEITVIELKKGPKLA